MKKQKESYASQSAGTYWTGEVRKNYIYSVLVYISKHLSSAQSESKRPKQFPSHDPETRPK